MALSAITITFNEEFTDTETLTFELYNTNTTTTETFTYTCVDGVRDFEEFLESTKVGIITGDMTCFSFRDGIYADYAETKWTIFVDANQITLTSVDEDTVFQNGSSAQDVTFSYSLVPNPVPKNNYFYEFIDGVGVEHRVDIEYTPLSGGDTIEIKGNYSLENPSDEDILSPLRPQQATLNIDASVDLTLNDLYEEEERIYKVTIQRDNNTIFVGWLSSDGLYENYVADKWVISLSAIDGLGYLQDIKYTDELGAFYSGKQTDIQKLTNTLVKTELGLGFRTSINIFYDGLDSVDILNNTYFNTERYYTENNNEPFNCKDILLSVLEKYNAVIYQKNGYWYITRPNELHGSANVTFYNYDSDGVLVSGENTITEDLSIEIGSDNDDFYPHFVNGNQQKSLRRSLGAYRVNLKYGSVFPYYKNVNANWDDASTIDDWTIVNASFVSPYKDLQGIRVTDAASPTIVMTSDSYTVDGSPRVEFKVTYSNLNSTQPLLGTGGAVFNCKIVYTVGSNTYYLTKQGDWVTSDELIQHGIGLGEQNFTLRVVAKTELPEPDGDIKIDLYDAGFDLAIYPLAIHAISLQTYNGEDESQGAFYTIEKLSPSTPSSDDVKKLIHGDVPDNTYYSAIYENDETTNTEFWYRTGYNESKPLLRIMVEDRLRMGYKPRTIFEGDVYGYVPLLSVIDVNNVNSKMMAIEWGYDAAENTTRLKLIQLLNEEYQDIFVAYSVTEDYGETIKPAITS